MTDKFSKLELAWRTRIGGGGATRRDYLDFVVNGQSLHDLLSAEDDIGCLGWQTQNDEQVFLEQLMAERLSELGNNHCPIYICPECGLLGCGAITVQIEKTEDGFLWKNFGYQNNYDQSARDFVSYEGIGPFHFKRSEYLETLESSKDSDERGHKNPEAT